MSENQETSPMVRLFRTEARARLVDTFLRRFDSTMTVAEVAESAGVDRTTVHRHMDDLVDIGLVDEVNDGASRAFRLNTESEATEALGQAHKMLLKQSQSIPPSEPDEERAASGQIHDFAEALPEHVTPTLLKKCLQHSTSFQQELVHLIRRHLPIINDHDSGVEDNRTNKQEESEQLSLMDARTSAASAAQGINDKIESTEEIKVDA